MCDQERAGRRSRLSILAASGCAVVFAAAGVAQDAPTPTPAPAPGAEADADADADGPAQGPPTQDPDGVDVLLPSATIIGSAEREWLLPGSGTYLDTPAIRTHSYDDINRVLRQVPGVYVREEEGHGLFPNISLRGVDPGRSGKVTLMEDGILMAPAPYSAPAAYYSPTVGRMSGLEVLMGSSQVQYGPHITGGALNYISTPVPERPTGYLKTLYGTDNDIRAHGYVGETFETEKWGRFGYLIEGHLHTTDGFKEITSSENFTGSDETGFTKTDSMLKLMWEPDGEQYSRLEFKAGYTDLDGDVSYLGLAEEDFNDDPFDRYPASRFDNIKAHQARFSLSWYVEPTENFDFTTTAYHNKFHRNWFKLNDLRNIDTDGDGTGDGVNLGLSAALAGAEGGAGLDVLRGERAGTLRVRANNRDYYTYGWQNVANYRFKTKGIAHTLTGGFRAHYDQINRFQHQDQFTQDDTGAITGVTRGAPGSQSDRKQETYAYSFFVQDEMDFGKLTLTPGVRYEHLDQSFEDFNAGASGSGNQDLIAGGVGANYQWNDQLALFGGVFRGYSPPGPKSRIDDGLDPETSINSELGLRYRSPRRAFSFKSTLFYSFFDDLIVADNVGAAGTVGDAENVGEIESYGLELTTRYDAGIANNWGFKNPYWIAFTYTNAELASDSESADAESIFSGGQKGNEVPYIPEYQLSFGAGLEVDRWGVFAIGNWVDEQFGTASNTDAQLDANGDPDARFGKIDSHFTLDVTGHYQFNDNVKLLGGVYNVFDEEYIASRLPHGSRPGMGRFLYIGAEMRF